MNSPRVSIICAVYRAEAYLRRCVDSVLAQTMPDFELLLIDDGSPDGSGAICDDYARRDARVRVAHKPNEGVSATRQYGIDRARGEYTLHVDPDDRVEPDMLEQLCAAAEREGADVVISPYLSEDNGLVADRPTGASGAAVREDLLRQRIGGSLCNKLIRRSLYDRYGVRFPEGINYMEDYLVCLQLLGDEVRVAYVDRPFYHYDCTSNAGSLTHVYTPTTFATRCRVLDEVERILGRTAEYYAQAANVVYEGLVKGVVGDEEFVRRFGAIKWRLLRHGRGGKTRVLSFLCAAGGQALARRLHRTLKRAVGGR